MTENEIHDDSAVDVTEPMRRFIDYFGELGPRWGIRAETSMAHALLYLAERPLDRDAVAAGVGIPKPRATAALRDLCGWEMATKGQDGRWRVGGQPWDLLFKALEARRRQEIAPALETLRACSADALADAETTTGVWQRIDGVRVLVEDLAAIDAHAQRLPRTLIPRLVRATGTASRLARRMSQKKAAGHA